MVSEMEVFNTVLKKYNVTVYYPEMIKNYYNQIFTRDIGFVIGVLLLSRIFCRIEKEN